MRNPGVLLMMPDGRKCVLYRKQPLLIEKGKVVIHLLKDDLSIDSDETGRPKTLIRDLEVYNEEAGTYTILGYAD